MLAQVSVMPGWAAGSGLLNVQGQIVIRTTHGTTPTHGELVEKLLQNMLPQELGLNTHNGG